MRRVNGPLRREIEGHQLCDGCDRYIPTSSFVDGTGVRRKRCWGCRQTAKDELAPVPVGVLPIYEVPELPPGPVGAADMFSCIPLRATISYRFCLERRAAGRHSANGYRERIVPTHPFCAVTCAQGRQNAELVQITIVGRVSRKLPTNFYNSKARRERRACAP